MAIMRNTLALGVFMAVLCFSKGFRIPRQSGYSTGPVQNAAPHQVPLAQIQVIGYQNFVAPALTGYHRHAAQQFNPAQSQPVQNPATVDAAQQSQPIYSLNLSQAPYPQGQFYPVTAPAPAVEPAVVAEAGADELEIAAVEPGTVAPAQEESVEPIPIEESVVPAIQEAVEESLAPVDEPKEETVLPEEAAQEIRINQADPVDEVQPAPVNPDSLLVNIPESTPVVLDDVPQDTVTLVEPLPELQDFSTFQGDFNADVPLEQPVEQSEQQPAEEVNDIPQVKSEDQVNDLIATAPLDTLPVAEEQPQNTGAETAAPTEAPQEVRTQPYETKEKHSGDISYFRNPVSVKALDAHVRANAARIVSEKFNEYMTDTAGFPGMIQNQRKAKQPSLSYGVPLAQPITWQA